MWRRFVSMLLLALPALGSAAPASLAVVTIVDGDALLIRDAAKLALAEGVRLAAGDIVEPTAASRLVRIEFDNGTLIDLAPGARAIVSPRLGGDRAKSVAPLYLLDGVAKLTVPAPTPGPVLQSSPLDVLSVARDAVVSVRAGDIAVFAESGEVALAERSGGRPQPLTKLKTGEFFSRSGGDKPAVAQRPSPAFVQQLPRAFRDTLPARAALFKGREVEAKPLGFVSFVDVQPWIDAEPALRGGFVTRWRARAADAQFRKPLAATLAAHPEWDRVLNPEKYAPKHPAAAPAVPFNPRVY